MSKKVNTNLNSISILKDSCAIWAKSFWKILFMTAIVAIPGSYTRVLAFDSVNDASIIASIAGLYLTLALTYSFLNDQLLVKNRFTKLYVLSSGRFLPFLFASIIFSVVTLPAALGVSLIILAISVPLSPLFIVLGVGLIVLCLYMMLRFSVATVLVVQNDITAFNAFRLSWQVTSKNLIRLFIAWAFVLIISVAISGIVLTGADYFLSAANNIYIQVAVNALLLLFVLPLFISYSVEITKRLER
ncbi:MAG: hypothetical protein QG675_431 [Patescibacteria group bacterium]|nr:hypothetical protein [Patescibacteria group bacterium]